MISFLVQHKPTIVWQYDKLRVVAGISWVTFARGDRRFSIRGTDELAGLAAMLVQVLKSGLQGGRAAVSDRFDCGLVTLACDNWQASMSLAGVPSPVHIDGLSELLSWLMALVGIVRPLGDALDDVTLGAVESGGMSIESSGVVITMTASQARQLQKRLLEFMAGRHPSGSYELPAAGDDEKLLVLLADGNSYDTLVLQKGDGSAAASLSRVSHARLAARLDELLEVL